MPLLISESILGPHAAAQLALPNGVDGASVLNSQLRSGLTVAQVIQNTAAAIGVVNQEVADMFSGLYAFTEQPYSIYMAGTGKRRMTPKKAEYKHPEGVRGAESGNMLPINVFTDALMWTEEWLRDARQGQLDASVRELTEGWRERVMYDFLTRIFSSAEIANGSGYEVPWAVASGSVPFLPPNNVANSTGFDSNHSHFNWADATPSATSLKAMLRTNVDDLRHHGYSGRLIGFVADADVDFYSAMGKEFVDLQPAQFTVVAGNTAAPVNITSGEVQGVPGELFGYYKGPKGVVELRYLDRIPTGYQFLTKSFGPGDQRNGLAVRVHPTQPFGLRLDPKGNGSIVNPQLEYIDAQAINGIGVNNRTNGVVGYVHSGATEYVVPDFSDEAA